MEPKNREVLETAVRAFACFKRVFGRDFTPSFLAEIYAALALDLELLEFGN